ncbi:alpha/beta hydrolase [Phycicoccus endophyticus]|uniref:Alpha/beta hydrolase n=1 Tax=Phycicoccus endophyticus TaxID=1690220 RepID=A0A7G9QZP8_9MICO|nr:alpha/beta hydrolase [Phycicoccus endophyticus]NHI20016.1 alpha/beta hydrolase [Phycicoccus endophyticus]QNN48823.1 alpha/beta hydrolase [Phycicoccus endophyticus]GGL42571.1 alpha/beta hydrolase [Phycicoccus endophyticus]
MPSLRTPDGVEVYYETDGDPSGRPLVLVHGGGAQLIGWHDDLVGQLTAAGFFVVRPDNRDVGLSQQTGGPSDLAATYDLSDMAGDVVALLDHLGIQRAHLAGMSMGGYIVQLVAIEHPERVASLGLMSTSPSSEPEFLASRRGDGRPVTTAPELLDKDAYVEMFVGGQRRYASPGFPFDAEESAALAGRYYERRYRPDGLVRQWNALLRGPLERREQLRAVRVPALVIHGRGDQSLHWRAAVALAEILPQAEVHIYEEMGHDIPRPLWPDFVRAFVRTATRAERSEDA